jgi:hypothetical protein
MAMNISANGKKDFLRWTPVDFNSAVVAVSPFACSGLFEFSMIGGRRGSFRHDRALRVQPGQDES